MLKTNRLKKDFFYNDRLIFGLDDPVETCRFGMYTTHEKLGKRHTPLDVFHFALYLQVRWYI